MWGWCAFAALVGAALAVGAFAWPLLADVLVAVASVAHTLYRPAHSALLPSLCTTIKELTGANAVRGLLDSLIALLGPAAAGLLVGPIGVDGVFAVSAGTALCSVWLVWRVAYEAPPRVGEVVQAGSHRTATVRALSSLSVLRFSGRQFVRAVTGYSPSSAAATTLMNDRLARGVSTTARNRPATSAHLT